MHPIKYAIVLAGASFLVAGCAPTMNLFASTDQIQPKAESYFGARPGQVKITNAKKGILDISFQATYKGVFYNCVLRYGDVQCEKPGGG